MTHWKRTLPLTVNLDDEADSAYIYLTEIAPGQAVEQRVVSVRGHGDVVLDFDVDGNLLGVEVIGAAALLPGGLLSGVRGE